MDTRKNTDRETYSFMVNNKSEEGKSIINFLNEVRSGGEKISNYVKKLILKDMQKISLNEHTNSLSNALLLEKLDKQEMMLKNLTNIIEVQNKEMSLLHALLSNGVTIGTIPLTSETAISSTEKVDIIDEDAEHEAFLEKAKKAIVAPDLASVIKDTIESEDEDSIKFNEDEDEDLIEFDDED